MLLRYAQVLHNQTPNQSLYFMFILVNKNNKEYSGFFPTIVGLFLFPLKILFFFFNFLNKDIPKS